MAVANERMFMGHEILCNPTTTKTTLQTRSFMKKQCLLKYNLNIAAA